MQISGVDFRTPDGPATNEIIELLMPHSDNTDSSNNDINLEVLIEARIKAALLVERYGDDYLPIFERLEKEIEEREACEDAKKRALLIAKTSGRE